jgi:hypothetical protein
MNLLQKVPVKYTSRLFHNKFACKVVVKTVASSLFRGKNLEKVKDVIDCPSLLNSYIVNSSTAKKFVDTEGGVNFLNDLYKNLLNLSEYHIRVEYPFISIYVHDTSIVNSIIEDIGTYKIKYVSIPRDGIAIPKDTVLCKHIKFKYKVHIGPTTSNYNSFLEWAEKTSNVRITNSLKKKLSRNRSYEQSFVYVKDEKTLTMVKIFLGNCITKIDSVLNY